VLRIAPGKNDSIQPAHCGNARAACQEYPIGEDVSGFDNRFVRGFRKSLPFGGPLAGPQQFPEPCWATDEAAKPALARQ